MVLAFLWYLGHAAGARRRALAFQLQVHILWVETVIHNMGFIGHGKRTATLTRQQLHMLMIELLGGDHKVPKTELDFVLRLADVNTVGVHNCIELADIIRPLAMWRGLQDESAFISKHFDAFDTNDSDTLDRAQLKAMLFQLNGLRQPDEVEIDWIMSYASDCNGIDKATLRVASANWFYNVAPLQIKAKRGWAMLVPFIYCTVSCIAASVVVAATTILFSEEKTTEWLTAVGMSLIWRNFLIDPVKAAFFGRTFEFVFGLIFGGCALEDAAMGVLQDEIEGSTEAAAEGAADVAAELADVSIDVVW